MTDKIKVRFPKKYQINGKLDLVLRYGENPHQQAAVYFEEDSNSPLQHLTKITGRELSYVNFTDIFAGLESVRIFDEPAAVVIKHNTPSGIALGIDLAEALVRGVEADAVSAFGGVFVVNKAIDLKAAQTLASFKEEDGVLVDIIAAPSITKAAAEFIKGIRKTTGIYVFGKIPKKRANTDHIRFFDGGFIVQDWDDKFNSKEWKMATEPTPSKKQFEQMELGWKFIGRIRSNTILVVDKDLPMTRGIGSGQTSRVRSTNIALEQAGKKAEGAILVSDSFFPFDDSIKLAAKAGIAAIVQQGGSVNDKLVIETANKFKIPMVLTGERKFWH